MTMIKKKKISKNGTPLEKIIQGSQLSFNDSTEMVVDVDLHTDKLYYDYTK